MVVAQETPTPTPQTSQPTVTELKDAKEKIKVLLEPETKKSTSTDKSVADVLDKSIDVIAGYVGTLESVVTKYAPEVWRVMIKQQYAKAIGYPLFWLLMISLLLIYYRTMKKWFNVGKDFPLFGVKDGGNYYDDEDTARIVLCGVIPILLGAAFSVVFLSYLSEGIMILINPEYYALKDIIGFLR